MSASLFGIAVFVVTVVALGLLCARLTVRQVSPLDDSSAPVPALRGILAMLVFVQSAACWYVFSVEGNWHAPEPKVFGNFEHCSIALFLMISGFAFGSRLLSAPAEGLDWGRLYAGRLLRLTPTYLFAMLLLLLIVGIETDFSILRAEAMWQGVRQWLVFSIRGSPDLNGMEGTRIALAGVTWCLAYFCFAYLSLPLLGLVLGGSRNAASTGWVLFSFWAVVMCYEWWALRPDILRAFALGILSAWMARQPMLRARLGGRGADAMAVLALAMVFTLADDAYGLPANLVMFAAFTPIACGASLFGLLRWQAAVRLGAISYGMFLLHGPLLFIVMRYIVGEARVAQFSQLTYALLVLALVPAVVGVGWLACRWLEMPARQRTETLVRRLRGEPRMRTLPDAGSAGERLHG